MVGSFPDVTTCAKFQVEFFGGSRFYGGRVEFHIFLLIFAWALQPVIIGLLLKHKNNSTQWQTPPMKYCETFSRNPIINGEQHTNIVLVAYAFHEWPSLVVYVRRTSTWVSIWCSPVTCIFTVAVATLLSCFRSSLSQFGCMTYVFGHTRPFYRP